MILIASVQLLASVAKNLQSLPREAHAVGSVRFEVSDYCVLSAVRTTQLLIAKLQCCNAQHASE